MKITVKYDPPDFRNMPADGYPLGTIVQTDKNKLFVRMANVGHGPLWMALESPFVACTGLSAARPVTIQEIVVVPNAS